MVVSDVERRGHSCEGQGSVETLGKVGNFVSVLVEVGIITPSSRRATSSALVRSRSYHSGVFLIEFF